MKYGMHSLGIYLGNCPVPIAGNNFPAGNAWGDNGRALSLCKVFRGYRRG